MPDLSRFGDFHFLRPEWLWGVLGAVALAVVVRQQGSLERQWRDVIAPHLLAALKVGGGGGWRLRPVDLVALALALGSLAAAGPAWQREPTPFTEDRAPLVIALDLSASMNAVDVAPTRLERAKQKVRDLLARRKGARTALVAYAGTAHVVLPLTDDPSVLEVYLADLATDLMPVPGKDPSAALEVAERVLERDETPGTILFLTDGIARAHASRFAAHARETRDAVMALAVGTSNGGPVREAGGRFATDASGRRIVATLDRDGFDALAAEAGAWVGGATVDDADIDAIERRMQRHLAAAQSDDPEARWQDAGYWLMFPVALVTLLWFRRGWRVHWGAAAVLVAVLGAPAPAAAQGFELADLWLTRDQQGRRAFDDGDYARAAARFEDPLWKGVAYYRAGDYESALDQFAQVDTAEGWFNLANTYARLGTYEEAVKAYEAALERRPAWTEAEENRDLVRDLIPPPETEGEEERAQAPDLPPDEIEFEEGKKEEGGEQQELVPLSLTDDQIAELWMRRMQTTPAEYLRRKFAVQAAEGGAEPAAGPGGPR